MARGKPRDGDVGRKERLQGHRGGDLAGADQAACNVIDLLMNRLEKVVRFKEVRNAIQRFIVDEHCAQQGLFGAIESRARARWKLVPAPAPNEIIVRLDKLDLRASREKEVVLAMTATMLWKDKDDPRPIMKSYEYLGPAAPLEDWIDNRDGFIARAFERGYARIADDLVGDLEGKSR